MIALPLGVPHCLAVLAHAAAPRAALSVSQWADDHRELSGKQSGERGRWRTARNPELREIMDCLSAESPVRDIVVKKSSQRGLTEVIINWIGYIMEHAPSPAMVLMPTLEARDAWKVQKLNPLFTETGVIKELLGGQRSRDAANRADLVDFPGGLLFLSGGNSANSYAQKSARYVVLDDLDRFPVEIGNEGDPVSLARGRHKAFARYKCLLVSTPTVHEESLIDREYQLTDQRHWHLPCPHCGEYQVLEWGGPDKPFGIKWNATLTEAWYLCRHCACEIHEHEKTRMLAQGRWIAQRPGVARRGYQLTALSAPIGLGPSWLELAQLWKTSARNPATLRAFVNTQLGEVWVEQGDAIEPTGLIARRELYADDLPVVAKTAGVDVQKDRLEITFFGWAPGEESWALEHHILPGDTARPEVWAELADLVADERPDAVAVDSGYNTSMVYAFCAARSFCFAIKGVSGPGRPIVEDERTRRQRLRRQRKKGIVVHMVGGDQAKALLYSRLKLTEAGPGYLHFPNSAAFDDEYFAQLTAEKLVTKIRGTRPYSEWVQTRPRNEALDCAVYALAALRLANINLAALAERLAEGKNNAAAVPRVIARRVGRIGRFT